jgi:hypothetical protein
MTISEVVENIIVEGSLTPSLAQILLRTLDTTPPQTNEDIEALDKLQTMVRSGKVVTVERKRCFNIMEEMVWEVIERQYATLKMEGSILPDAGDVAAYALNHLRPLYAVSETGADFQREKAKQEHSEIVGKRVRESIEHSLGRPVWHPERKPLAPNVDKENIVSYLQLLLKGHI